MLMISTYILFILHFHALHHAKCEQSFETSNIQNYVFQRPNKVFYIMSTKILRTNAICICFLPLLVHTGIIAVM